MHHDLYICIILTFLCSLIKKPVQFLQKVWIHKSVKDKLRKFLHYMFSTLANSFVQPMRSLFYGLSAVLWALMNYQRKPIMERYSYFMGCALRYIAGLILSRSKNYNYGTSKIFWPLYSKVRQLCVASSLWQGMQCATDRDCNLVSAVWPGKDVRIFYIADCVDFYIVEHYKV